MVTTTDEKINPPNDSGQHLSTVDAIGGIAIHPAANLFPMLDADAHQRLVDDIRANDIQVTLKAVGESRETAQLVDGRNRLKALIELGRDPWDYIEVIHPDDLGDPVQYVLSLNLHRRHLNESQRAMVAARVATLSKGRQSNASIEAPSQSAAADTLKVSRASVQRAKLVANRAAPEIVQAVERGSLSVSAAAEVATLPIDDQRQLAEAGPKAIKQAAASKRVRKAESSAPSGKSSLAELRELFDGMEKPDELAVTRFCLWIQERYSDLQAIQNGCNAWLEWGAE